MRRNETRIGAGFLKNRAVYFPPILHLRPTPSRVKETLVNWLGQHLAGFSVLDLFAGSGALGFEALSRGADFVHLNDSNNAAVRALKENAKRFNLSFCLPNSNLVISQVDAFLLLDSFIQNKQFFDVVFLDPPFSQNLWLALEKVEKVLKPSAFLYVENAAEIATFGTLLRHKFLKAGEVCAHLFGKKQ